MSEAIELIKDDVPYHAWVDIETTCIKPTEGHILEVYFRITDRLLRPLGEFHSYVAAGPIDGWNEFCQKMHRENGLIEDMARANQDAPLPTAAEVSKEICKFLSEHNGGDPKSLYLSGSSTKFDFGWLGEHMPDVLDCVHYRTVDVSSTRVQMAGFTGEDWVYPKAKGHRASADVDETIAEYRYLWGKFVACVLENSAGIAEGVVTELVKRGFQKEGQ